jgi:hypothetical protein
LYHEFNNAKTFLKWQNQLLSGQSPHGILLQDVQKFLQDVKTAMLQFYQSDCKLWVKRSIKMDLHQQCIQTHWTTLLNGKMGTPKVRSISPKSSAFAVALESTTAED